MTEDTTELITKKVSEVSDVLAEKLKIEAVRIGPKLKKQAPRPVKVSFSIATVVTQILSKRSALRESDQLKGYLSVQTAPQRALHRELVVQLKTKKTNEVEPNKRHCIIGDRFIALISM